MDKYKNWDLFEKLPKGWRVDKSAGSPLCGYEFCNNKKSVLNDGLRALVKVPIVRISRTVENGHKNIENDHKNIEKQTKQVIDSNYVKTANILARKKFEERLLKDIQCDLVICDLEGWDKKEYIKELKQLIDSFALKLNKKNKKK